MGNFDFIKTGAVIRTELIALGNKREDIFDRFNEAESLIRIDFFAAAYKLRIAWAYILHECNIERGEYFHQWIEKMFEDDELFRVGDNRITPAKLFIDRLLNRNNLNIDVNRTLLEFANDIIHNNCSVSRYIATLENRGAHEVDFQTDAENPNNQSINEFFNELTFEKVALGFELSRFLLTRSYQFDCTNAEQNAYDLGSIPIGRYNINLRPLDVPHDGSEADELKPYRYIVGGHRYIDGGRNVPLNEYALIKEYKLFDGAYRYEAVYAIENKFTLMVERKNYITSQLGISGASIHLGSEGRAPFRYITYPVPVNQFDTFNDGSPLKRIDTLTNRERNLLDKSFFVELAKIFSDLEEKVPNILIRGVCKENIWVYKADNKYHPIFTGYELCAIQSDDSNAKSFNTFTKYANAHLDEQVNAKYYMMHLKINDNLPNKEFLASFLGVVFDICLDKFDNTDYDRDSGAIAYFDLLFKHLRVINQEKLANVRAYLINNIYRMKVVAGNQGDSADLPYKSATEIYNAFSAATPPRIIAEAEKALNANNNEIQANRQNVGNPEQTEASADDIGSDSREGASQHESAEKSVLDDERKEQTSNDGAPKTLETSSPNEEPTFHQSPWQRFKGFWRK